MSQVNLFYDNRNNRVYLRNPPPNRNIQPNRTPPPPQSQNNDVDANQLLEINVKEFFEKFGPKYDNQIIEGPRGFPGMIGPQGPPGKGIDEELIQRLLHNSHKSLLYGLKKTNITEINHSQHSSNSYFKMMKNNESGNEVIFDSFYLSPNVLEINEYSKYNYIHDRKIEKFKNSMDNLDVQYFPLEYTPCGFPIQLKKENNELVIQNISWNIVQFIKNIKNMNLLGVVYQKNEIEYKPIDLQLHFELHSQIPNHLIDNKRNLLPYENHVIKVLNPSQTCLTTIKSIKINTLNGSFDEEINIPIQELTNLNDIHNILLCVRLSIDQDNVYFLKGSDIHDKINYGYIPFTQLLINFDYYLKSF